MALAIQPFAVQDRTNEFRSCIASLSKLNHSTAGSSRQGLLDKSSNIYSPNNSGNDTNGGNGSYNPKSEFAIRASGISKEIVETTSMLQRLALLAKRKTLFDDKPVEISELTFVIKQKVSKINKSILALQEYVKSNRLASDPNVNNNSAASAWGGGGGGASRRKNEQQLAEHANNVVVSLQGKLTEVTTGFEEVLEVRIKNIQASKNRTEQFISSAAASSKGSESLQSFNNMDSPLYSTSRSRTPSNNYNGSPLNNNSNNNNNGGINNQIPIGGTSLPLSSSSSPQSVHASKTATPIGGATISENPYALDGFSNGSSNGGGGGGDYLALPEQQQTLALLEEQHNDSYMAQRSNAVEAIESTIQELGGIFQQLATMVSEQRETIQRIDADTEDISLNVSGAQRELLKYYSRISSNRGLIIKSFGIILIFFFIWVLVS